MKKFTAIIKTKFTRIFGKVTFMSVIAASLFVGIFIASAKAQTSQESSAAPYEDMPEIAPISVRVGKYLDVPESAKGPAVDRLKATGFRNSEKDYIWLLIMLTNRCL